MTPDGLRGGRRALDDALASIAAVDVTAGLLRAAADLADEHGLRGYDAVHLASSLVVDSGRTVMVTWDRELALAACASGLDVAGAEIEAP